MRDGRRSAAAIWTARGNRGEWQRSWIFGVLGILAEQSILASRASDLKAADRGPLLSITHKPPYPICQFRAVRHAKTHAMP